MSQNSTDKIGGVIEWTQANIFRYGTYGLQVQSTTKYHKMVKWGKFEPLYIGNESTF